MAKVSIIIPVYNVEKYLHNCIDSVIAQTFPDWELILIDDGSTDNSYAVACSYMEKDLRIRVIENGHKGVSTARNTGIELASGEYIMFIDSDDTVTPDACAVLINAIEDSDFAVATYQKIYKDTGNVIEHPVRPFHGSVSSFCRVIEEYLGEAILQGPCFKLFKKELIVQNNVLYPKNIDFGEDAYFVYTYMNYIRNICVVNRSIYQYYVHGKSLSHGFRPDKYRINLVLNRMVAELLEKYGVADYDRKEKLLNRTAFSAFINDCALNKDKSEAMAAIQSALAEEKTKVAYQDAVGLSLKQKLIQFLVQKNSTLLLLLVSKCNQVLIKYRLP